MEITAWWAFLVLVWIATLNTFSMAELITAAVLAVPCAVAARAARRAARVNWTLSVAWGRWLLLLPAAIAHDTIAVLLLALRRGTREGDDEFRTLTLLSEPNATRRAGREAATTALLSATPGSVVVRADREHRELLVHALPIGRTSLERELSR